MEEKSILDELSAEIWRIVSSPYPVSLKTLHEILSRDKDGEALSYYAATNPCKLRFLASCVLDIIECRPFAVDLLVRLCTSKAFRSHALQLRPDLLDTLLTKAIKGHDNAGHLSSSTPETKADIHQHSSACLQILRQPLPETLPLPASTETFFTYVIKQAVSSPSPGTLTAAYDLLSGACRHLPQILPRQDWAKLEVDLVRIVKSSRTIHDQSLSLLCLGILRSLARQTYDTALQSNSDAQAFFTGSKAPKSLNLAALQAAWITRTTHDVAKADVLRSLDIVFGVLDATLSGTLLGWCRSAEGQGAMSRLIAQCSDSSISIDIRLKLFSIVARTHDPHLPSGSFTNQFSAFVRECTYLRVDNAQFSESMEAILPLLDGVSTSEIWGQFIRQVVQAASSTSCSLIEIRNIEVLIEKLQFIVTDNQTLAGRLLSEFNKLDGDSLAALLQEDVEPVSCARSRICYRARICAKRALVRTFASLWLATVIHSSLKKMDNMVGIFTRLVEILRGDADISIRDCDLPSKTRQAFVFVEQPSSEPGFCEGSWKHKLRRFASQQSEWNEQKLIQIVTGICGDLEERCENAEKPFREAEERAAEMERVVADLREHNTGLEQQAVDLNFRLSVMEAEKAEVQDALQGENERLIERVHALERALKESNDDAEAQIDRLISKHKARDLELRTMITEKEVLVDELSAECEEIRKIQRTTESTLQQTENRAAGLIKEVKDLQSMLNCQKHELEEQKKANQSLDHEMQELKGDREETVKFLNALQQKYDQRCREAQQSASDHMAEVTRLESRLQEDASRHAKNVQDMQKEEAAEKRIFREKEEQLLASLEAEKASKEDLQRQQKQVNSTLHNQQKQIEQLQEIVATKEEEIAKFQAMRQTLAAAIGQLPRRKHSRKSVQYAPSAHRPLASRWQSSGLIGKHAASSLKNAASDLYGGKAFPSTADVSFESESTQTGSTPKQAKPRKPFKVPTIRQPCVSTISTPKSVKVRSQRLPLTDISAACDNKLPSCQVASVKSLKFDHNSENVKIDGAGDADELEFDSEISISTPFTLAAPQCSVGHDVDETVDE